MEVAKLKLKTKDERLRLILHHFVTQKEDINSIELEKYIHYWNTFYVHYPELITRIICDIYGVTYEKILSNSRKRELVEPRHLCFYYFKIMKGGILYNIGDFYNRNHATVLHGCRLLEGFIKIKERDFYPNFIHFQAKIIEYKDYL